MTSSNDWVNNTNTKSPKKQKVLKKQRSISPRKVKGLPQNERHLYKSLETLSTIQVRHQRKDNQMYMKTLQRITRQLENIRTQKKNISVIQKQWVHKPFT